MSEINYKASDLAKKLDLYHLGYGKYAYCKDHQCKIAAFSKKGILTPVGKNKEELQKKIDQIIAQKSASKNIQATVSNMMIKEGLLNEAYKSNTLASILKMAYSDHNVDRSYKNVFNRIYSYDKVDWANIPESDVIKLSVENARKQFWNTEDRNHLVFWISLNPSVMLAITKGKDFLKKYGTSGRRNDRLGRVGDYARTTRWNRNSGATEDNLSGIRDLQKEAQICYAVDISEHSALEKLQKRAENKPEDEYTKNLKKQKSRAEKIEILKKLKSVNLEPKDVDPKIKAAIAHIAKRLTEVVDTKNWETMPISLDEVGNLINDLGHSYKRYYLNYLTIKVAKEKNKELDPEVVKASARTIEALKETVSGIMRL